MNYRYPIYWLIICLITAHSTQAQTNYVANLPNSANPPGLYNTLVGTVAGNANTSGYSNVLLGYSAGISNTTGHDNAFMGYNAGDNSTKGSLNTFIGTQAGVFLAVNDQPLTNATALGADAQVSISNIELEKANQQQARALQSHRKKMELLEKKQMKLEQMLQQVLNRK